MFRIRGDLLYRRGGENLRDLVSWSLVDGSTLPKDCVEKFTIMARIKQTSGKKYCFPE